MRETRRDIEKERVREREREREKERLSIWASSLFGE